MDVEVVVAIYGVVVYYIYIRIYIYIYNVYILLLHLILYKVALMLVLTFPPSTLIFVLCALTFGPCMVTNASCACFPSMNHCK